MNSKDYKTLGAVKAVLVRQWFDTAKCQYTCTNGVVYFTGSLHLHLDQRAARTTFEYVHELLQAARRLDRTLRQLPDVRDVIYRLDNLRKEGSKWKEAAGIR